MGVVMSTTGLFLSNMETLRQALRKAGAGEMVDRQDTLHKLIVEFLAQEPMSVERLSSEIGENERRVRDALSYLQDGRLVQRRKEEGPDLPLAYELTPYAREALSFFSVKG
jgi:hypothetical protein